VAREKPQKLRDDFCRKTATATNSLINNNTRLYTSLILKAYSVVQQLLLIFHLFTFVSYKTMADSKDIIPAHWRLQNLTSANWSEFEQDVLTAAHARLLNYYEYGAMAFILSPAQWAALPGNTVNGVVREQPEVPPIPDQPAPSNGQAADDRRYDQEQKAWIRNMDVRAEVIIVVNSFKTSLLDRDIVGIHYDVALGSGDMIAKISDTPQRIFARLKEHLGTPDAGTFKTWKRVYEEPATDKEIRQWIREDEHANTLLSPFHQQLSPAQRLTALVYGYRHSAPVMTCWRDYCKANPGLAHQTLPGALAYILLQEPNIRAEMSKADIGVPSHLAAAAWDRDRDTGAAAVSKDVDGGAYAAAAPASYSQAQLEKAVAEAVARERSSRGQQAGQYCWLHGYNRSHIGLKCKGIARGKHIRALRDSRASLPDTMVFDRSGCITSERAQEAAGPLTVERHPGNAIKPGDIPHA
jgi:hypothetical protein